MSPGRGRGDGSGLTGSFGIPSWRIERPRETPAGSASRKRESETGARAAVDFEERQMLCAGRGCGEGGRLPPRRAVQCQVEEVGGRVALRPAALESPAAGPPLRDVQAAGSFLKVSLSATEDRSSDYLIPFGWFCIEVSRCRLKLSRTLCRATVEATPFSAAPQT